MYHYWSDVMSATRFFHSNNVSELAEAMASDKDDKRNELKPVDDNALVSGSERKKD